MNERNDEQLTPFDVPCPTCGAQPGRACWKVGDDKVHTARNALCLKRQSDGYTRNSPPPEPSPINYTQRIYHLLVFVVVVHVIGAVALIAQAAS